MKKISFLGSMAFLLLVCPLKLAQASVTPIDSDNFELDDISLLLQKIDSDLEQLNAKTSGTQTVFKDFPSQAPTPTSLKRQLGEDRRPPKLLSSDLSRKRVVAKSKINLDSPIIIPITPRERAITVMIGSPVTAPGDETKEDIRGLKIDSLLYKHWLEQLEVTRGKRNELNYDALGLFTDDRVLTFLDYNKTADHLDPDTANHVITPDLALKVLMHPSTCAYSYIKEKTGSLEFMIHSSLSLSPRGSKRLHTIFEDRNYLYSTQVTITFGWNFNYAATQPKGIANYLYHACRETKDQFSRRIVRLGLRPVKLHLTDDGTGYAKLSQNPFPKVTYHDMHENAGF